MSDKYLLQQKLLAKNSSNKLFLHLKYNPADPSSTYIQKLWKDLVVQPKDKPHLTHLKNHLGERFTVSRLVLAYSRHPNIGNLLSYRKKCNRPILPGLDISKPYPVLFKWQELPPASLLPFEKNMVLKLCLSYCVIIYHGPLNGARHILDPRVHEPSMFLHTQKTLQ